jgi:OFA family oxalate/formate antiporter-like MFS transporter
MLKADVASKESLMQHQPPTTAGRWRIAAAGTVLQLCLGTVYAWSFFQQPLVDTYGWTHAQVIRAFSLAIGCLGLAAAWGGARLARSDPRQMAMIGGLLFGLGYLLAAGALAAHSLWLLYAGYGVLGGVGLGLGYVTPVATVAKWFPDKKGLATGIVIMGFGFGALVMSKLLAPTLLTWTGGNLVAVFAWLGLGLGGTSLAAAAVLRNPPATAAPNQPSLADGETVAEAVFSRQFLGMWLLFFCNIVAGISIIGFQSPLAQDLWRTARPSLTSVELVAYGATLIAVSSLFNGFGRMLWGGLSDRLGRLPMFRLMLASQLAAFLVLAVAGSPWLFAVLVCYVLLCYGGGFGTMPSFVLDSFGSRRMPAIYGLILTAWSAAGVVGPQLVGRLKDAYGAAAAGYAFYVAAGFVGAGLCCSFLVGQAAPREDA